MIRIKGNGDVIINGINVSDLAEKTGSKTVQKNVVIENGKVVQNDLFVGDKKMDIDEFSSEFIEDIEPLFGKVKKDTKIKCQYCGSIYKLSKEKCPNCGASNN